MCLTIPARAARANARAAASQLEAVSPAYSKELASIHDSIDGLVQTNLDGLTWWVPIDRSVPGASRERVVAK